MNEFAENAADEGAPLEIRSCTRRGSFLWLAFAFLLGGVPLLVYFTSPGAKVLNLLLGIGAFGGFGYAFLREFCSITSLRLNPMGRTLVFSQGGFRKQKVDQYRFSDVSSIDLKRTTLSSRGGGSTWYEIQVVMRSGQRLIIQKPTAARAIARGEALSEALGVGLVKGAKEALRA